VWHKAHTVKRAIVSPCWQCPTLSHSVTRLCDVLLMVTLCCCSPSLLHISFLLWRCYLFYISCCCAPSLLHVPPHKLLCLFCYGFHHLNVPASSKQSTRNSTAAGPHHDWDLKQILYVLLAWLSTHSSTAAGRQASAGLGSRI
jgi:hypothetical protein